MDVFYSDHFVLPLPQGHRFPMDKYARLRAHLAADWPEIRWHEAPPCHDEALHLVHMPAYVQAVVNGTLDAAACREIGFPWSLEMVERSRRSVGATVAAARVALQGRAIAANLAGGTHHAYADRGSGFCVFNDVAVAARQMQAEWRRSVPTATQGLQVAVVDLDVHQGNGTAKIFQDDPSVFTLSLHGERNFPFRKEASDCDIALPDGCGDDDYLAALSQGLQALERAPRPGLLFYLAGADIHEGDRLGRLRVSDAGMRARDRQVFDWAWQRRIPMVMVMAGGYGHHIDTTLQVQRQTFEEALSHARRWEEAVSR